MSQSLEFNIINKCNSARESILILNHGSINTPTFMPVGTSGAIKCLTTKQIENIGYKIMLGNTYHLSTEPGVDLISNLGTLHSLINYSNNLLTDSGGFQMVSLSSFSKVTEEGVLFKNPKNEKLMMLTPEKSIEYQNKIGADIIMQLDDVISSVKTDKKRFEVACHRTIRWLDRCIKSHKNKKNQSLFGIIQGGLDKNLRIFCVKEMVKRNLDGYAIGGLAGGEDKESFWKVIHICTSLLPIDKPRYVMGIGYPVDLVICSVMGCDMYDSVFPARMARFGIAFNEEGFLNLKRKEFKDDFKAIDNTCKCNTCLIYTRAAIHTIVGKKIASCQLLTLHNLTYIFKLMEKIRESIRGNYLKSFVKVFMKKRYKGKYPSWVKNALDSVDIKLE